jgi:hypothetical protein
MDYILNLDDIKSLDIRFLYDQTRVGSEYNNDYVTYLNITFPDTNITGEEIARFYEIFCFGANYAHKEYGYCWGQYATVENLYINGFMVDNYIGYSRDSMDGALLMTPVAVVENIELLRKEPEWLIKGTNSGEIHISHVD